MGTQTTNHCRVWSLLALIGLLPGCSERAPVIQSERIDTSTPVGQFEWAMTKLERAVIEFQPSAADGLQVGERKVSYEVFPPSTDVDHYTARVVIESETLYVHDEPLEDLEKQREERRRARAREDFSKQVETEESAALEDLDPLDKRFVAQMEDIATKPRPRMPEPILETPQMSDRKVYQLAYRDDRWQLESETDSDHERLWFEYALSP